MRAADGFAARDRLFGEGEEVLCRRSPVRGHVGPYFGRERDGHVAPQCAHRQHDHFEHREARQHGRREIGPRIVDRQTAGVLCFALGMRAQLQELLAIGDGEVAERAMPLRVGNARQRGGRERERRVARREQVREAIERVHGAAFCSGRVAGGGADFTLSAFRLSATAGRRGAPTSLRS